MATGARMAIVLLIAACAGAAGSSRAAAQDAQGMDARGFQLTREELQTTLERLEEASSSRGYSREIREQAAREAALVRTRLEGGDFRVGDRIVLRVRGHAALSDTLVVESGQIIRLPDIGEISLQGVLRSELQSYLSREIERYIRNPVVTAESLIRLAIMGEVGRPGFMVLPASMLLEDALMAAGGPAREADLDRIRIERAGEPVWEGASLQDALVQGMTLDQLNLRAGDRIDVPRREPALFRGGVIRTLLVTIPALFVAARRLRLF